MRMRIQSIQLLLSCCGAGYPAAGGHCPARNFASPAVLASGTAIWKLETVPLARTAGDAKLETVQFGTT